MNHQRIMRFIVGGYLWLMMILLGSIVLEAHWCTRTSFTTLPSL
jgi:uncharacterized membrane protein YesL